MKELGQIFDSDSRVKIMRLFIFNEDDVFDIDMVAKRSKSTTDVTKREIKLLEKTGFIKKKNFIKEITVKPTRRKIKRKHPKKSDDDDKKTVKLEVEEAEIKKKKAVGWTLDKKFGLKDPLKRLLVDSELLRTKELPLRFSKAGLFKVIVLSGIFVRDDDRKIDLLIVGEKVDKKKLDKVISEMESEIGKELRYSLFTPEEFSYRLNMYDTLLMDIFDYPHQKILDKIGLDK